MRSVDRGTTMRWRSVVVLLIILFILIYPVEAAPDHAAKDRTDRGQGQDTPPGLAHAPGQQKTVPEPDDPTPVPTPEPTPEPTTEVQTPVPTPEPTTEAPTPVPTPVPTTEVPTSDPTPKPTLTSLPSDPTPLETTEGPSSKPVPEDTASSLPGLAVAALVVSAGALGGVLYTRRRGNPPLPTDEDVTVVVPPAAETGWAGSGFPPALMEKYTEVAPVGSGGTAQVFRAVRRADDQTVAVKVPLRQDEATGRCFLREISIWQGLVHPNIVEVYAVNVLPVPYVETEYLARTLKDLKTPLGPAESVKVVAGIAAGLAYAHGHGVVHRDLKPGNILLATDGTPRIADWGLGKVLGEGDETVAPGYSLHYAAPEQLSPARFGHPDERTDLYQLGVVFYELLTGTLPFDDEGPGAYSAAILSAPPRPPSVVDAALAPFDRIVLRCLVKEPAARFESAEEFLAALGAVEY